MRIEKERERGYVCEEKRERDIERQTDRQVKMAVY